MSYHWILERRHKHLVPVLSGTLIGAIVISAAIIIFKFRQKLISLLISQHCRKADIDLCRTPDRTVQRSNNKDNFYSVELCDDDQPVNSIGSRNPSLTEDDNDFSYVVIKHAWKRQILSYLCCCYGRQQRNGNTRTFRPRKLGLLLQL
ncbi:hypothetical protein XENTR_v10022650 [Xenopus tropicalis]|nr:hypothetical protein XENTR_v10022650 [Xenopus tropicalis]